MQWEGAWSASQDTTTPSVAPTLTAGRGLIIAVVGTNAASWTAPTVTGTGNTVSVALTPVASAAPNTKVGLYYISSITTGGSQTVTTGTFAAGKGSIFVRECSGQDTSDMLDDADSATGTSASAAVTLTASVADDIIVAFGGADYGGGDPSNYGILTTIAVTNLYAYNWGGDTDAAGATGSKTVTFTLAGSDDWIIAAAAFKSAGATDPEGSLIQGKLLRGGLLLGGVLTR